VRTFLQENIVTDDLGQPDVLDSRVRVIEYLKDLGIHVDGTIPEKLRKMSGGLSAKQLGPIIGISHITLYRMAERKGIPSYRMGTKLLFDPTRIADWLEN